MAGLVHYKYSHSTRASTEYFGYEYEYLRFQRSEYEYWNSVLRVRVPSTQAPTLTPLQCNNVSLIGWAQA